MIFNNKPSSHYEPPSALLSALEFRALPELLCVIPMLPHLMSLPKSDGNPVLVFPGFLANDYSTAPLRKFLTHLQYDVYGWQQGINLGPKPGAIESSQQLVLDIFKKTGKPVSLIGWSLGGIFARETAKLLPDITNCVITLGTPFAEQTKSTKLSTIYKTMTRRDPITDAKMFQLPEAPPVPTTSIFSKSDGVVGWQSSIQKEEENNPLTENVEIYSSHLGMGAHPLSWLVIADRLEQPNGSWKKYTPIQKFKPLFP